MNPQAFDLAIVRLVGCVKGKRNLPVPKQPSEHREDASQHGVERAFYLFEIGYFQTGEHCFARRAANTDTSVVREVSVLYGIKEHMHKVVDLVRGIAPNNAKYMFQKGFQAFVDMVACHIGLAERGLTPFPQALFSYGYISLSSLSDLLFISRSESEIKERYFNPECRWDGGF